MNQPVMTVPHHDALIYAMVTMSAADRTMTDRELKKIGDIVQTLPVFNDYDHEKLVATAEACGDLMQSENGLDLVLNVIASSLPEKLHETAYALAVEVAAADLSVGQEELRFLQLLRDRLNLQNLIVAAIERGARARHTVV